LEATFALQQPWDICFSLESQPQCSKHIGFDTFLSQCESTPPLPLDRSPRGSWISRESPKHRRPGLGDDAHYITTPGFGTGLSVKKGSFAFKVRVYGFSDDVVKLKEKELAQGVLTKL
jgi:hypothetical protein